MEIGIIDIIYYSIALLYFGTLSYITVYCLMQFHLLYHYKKHHNILKIHPEEHPQLDDHTPMVTIQLPIFNEMYVVERLVDNIIAIDYPREKLEIQILDDSTDETVNISRRKVEQYRKQGYDISLVLRSDRKGYKAGALKEATTHAKGEFIAIFDADFLPEPDFLKRTIPYFQNPNVGVVQTRWTHINQEYSLLTKLQAFQLNVHFTVEQQGRESGEYLLQFNGTAGVWRKSTIDDAGGWEADTLTEDLDLSYRAQLKGWQIMFLEDCTAPAELPAEMNGLKSQQFRWMKGGAETARKMLPTIWKSELSLSRKLHGSLHLLASSVFPFVFVMGVMSVPFLFVINPLGIDTKILSIFMISLLSIIMVYFVANVQGVEHEVSRTKKLIKFIFLFPVFLALSMGLSLHNTVAVIQGWLGKQSAFIRTPKFNILDITDKIKSQKYLQTNVSAITIMEGIMTLYFFIAMIFGIYTGNNTLVILHALLGYGYGTIFYLSLKHVRS